MTESSRNLDGDTNVPVTVATNTKISVTIKTQRDAVYQAVENLLRVLPINLSAEAQQETPRRFTDYLLEFCHPVDPMAILKEGFEAGSGEGGMVIQQNIPLRGLCEHHLAPYFGYAHIAY